MTGLVHKSIAHESAIKHVAGTAPYIDDLLEPAGLLHLQLGLSAKAHARVTNLDLDGVRSAPGIVAVLTARDVPGRNDVSPWAGDDPLFADGLVQYVGQPMFAVVATSRKAARAAIDRANIAYEELPALISVDQAMDAQSLLEPPNILIQGDPRDAIDRAPMTCRGRFYIGGQEHFYLEGQIAMALPGEGNSLTVHCSTQHPTEIQHTIAHVLDVPFAQVNVEVRRMGGGFGGKETHGNLPAAAVALAARICARPVKCRYDRDDDMMITGKRHDFRIDYEIGFDATGKILGLIVEHAVRCGMSFDLSQAIADRAMLHADNCYVVPHIQITSYRCKTHTQSATAFRGFGGPQGMLAMERMLDAVARKLDMDPLDLRQRNFYPHKDSKDPGTLGRTPYGMVVEDCIIQDITAELIASSQYHERRAQIAQWNRTSPVIKRGLAFSPVKFGISFTKTEFNQAGALVHLYTDGSIHLNHGGTEMGQGLNTKVAQVVADVFAVDLDMIAITPTNTSKVPNTSATAASSGSDLNGKAAQNAALAIRARLVTHLAQRFGMPQTEIKFRRDGVHVGPEILSLAKVAQSAYAARVSLSSTGFYATPKIEWDRTVKRGRPFFYFAYGAAVGEVAIDTLTGEHRILRTDILHDVGRSLNPALDLGQIEGGFVQGAGWLTFEELVYDASGRLRTHAPSTYKIPTCGDRPLDLRIALFSRGENSEETIYRSKAVGEPPLMLGHCIYLAILDALAEADPARREPQLDAPATPERVLLALGGL